MLRMAELLIHNEDVPLAARVALTSALSKASDDRLDNLREAARILHFDTGLPCEDACELVGLGAYDCADES